MDNPVWLDYDQTFFDNQGEKDCMFYIIVVLPNMTCSVQRRWWSDEAQARLREEYPGIEKIGAVTGTEEGLDPHQELEATHPEVWAALVNVFGVRGVPEIVEASTVE